MRISSKIYICKRIIVGAILIFNFNPTKINLLPALLKNRKYYDITVSKCEPLTDGFMEPLTSCRLYRPHTMCVLKLEFIRSLQKQGVTSEYESCMAVFLCLLSIHHPFPTVCKVNSALGKDCFLNAAEDLSDYKEDEYRGTRD